MCLLENLRWHVWLALYFHWPALLLSFHKLVLLFPERLTCSRSSNLVRKKSGFEHSLWFFHWVTFGPVPSMWPVTAFLNEWLNDGKRKEQSYFSLWKLREVRHQSSGAGWGLVQLRFMMAKGQLNSSTLHSDLVALSPVWPCISASLSPGRLLKMQDPTLHPRWTGWPSVPLLRPPGALCAHWGSQA